MNGLTERVIRDLERIEVEACRSWTDSPPASVKGALGLGMRDLGAGLAVVARRLDVLMYNRVVGLGVGAPATAGQVDEAVTFFREAGVPRCMIQLAPTVQARVADWLGAHGFAPHNHWLRLWRAGFRPVSDPPDPRVRPIGTEHAEAFGRVVAEAFGHSEGFIPWFAAGVGRPGWYHWAALEDGEPVGFAALFVEGRTGWLGFAATQASSRKRGIQRALIATRLRAAAELGCDLLSVETADDTPEKPNPSTHNLLAMGFEIAYRRPNWVLKFPSKE